MASLNRVFLIGNLGSDPEMRYTPNGNPVTSFRIATNRSYRGSDGEWKQETEWFSITVWGKQAETISQQLGKGQRVFVEGRLRTSSWEGQDGQKRQRVEVVANRVFSLERQPSSGVVVGEGGDLGEMIEPEDIPFSE